MTAEPTSDSDGPAAARDGGPAGGGDPGGPSAPPDRQPRHRPLADLVLPLATLLGLAERPGEGHGLGPLDPALCRDLALAAAGSPWTRLCVTVTDPDGIAIGHGCATAADAKPSPHRGTSPGSHPEPANARIGHWPCPPG